MNYTPGPWSFEPHFDNGFRIQSPVGTRIASILPSSYWADETEENARLIATAPELLEITQECLAFFKEKWREVGNHPASHYRSFVEDLQRVIDKATKETHHVVD